MYSRQERAQLRAALQLWRQIASTSKVHPSEVPAVKAEFIVDGEQPLSTDRLEALLQSLSAELGFSTITMAAAHYGVAASRLARQLERNGVRPIPGSKVFIVSDIIYAINGIKGRDSKDFFGRPT